MSNLNFDTQGYYLTPNVNISSTLEILKEEFVISENRKRIFEEYIGYSKEIKKILDGATIMQWVDGSFISKAYREPKDVDIVTFINYELVEKYERQLSELKARRVVGKCLMDAYIVKTYPENHPRYPLYNTDRIEWFDQFHKTRKDEQGKKHKKGWLEIYY